jgi:ASPIC and UnbV/FG-GAP-like repeat
MRCATALSCAAAVALLPSCEDAVGADPADYADQASHADDAAQADQAWFADEAEARGLVFVHQSGARGEYLMPEIMSGGAALFDMDGDGDLDAYLVQSGALTDPPEKRPPNQLFENSGTGTFADVTEASGAGDRGIGMGVACGDADGDGDVDLLVANLGADVLLSNAGGGRFTDATARAGVADTAWSSSAAFLDADLDGDLDLWVCHYLNWVAAAEHECMNHSGARDYCSPKVYQAPALDSFFRNRGDGSYDDATRSAGIDRAATSLGVACLDADEDGWLDVFVANDGMPNQIWRNQGGARFVETGLQDGCAVDFDGAAKAGMGVAASDPDGDGDTDLLVCNLETESDSLFENRGGHFADRTAASNLRTISRPFTRFGVGWQDFDADGLLDLYVANGRVMRLNPPLADDPYAEPNLVLRGVPGGRYAEVLPRGGTATPLVATSRAAAFGDVDGDGAVDVLVVNRDGPAHLLINRAPARGHWLGLRLLDGHGDAVHARLTAHVGEQRFTREVRTAYSYQSSSTPWIHLGLGEAARVERVEVRWTDGAVEAFGPYDADQAVELVRRVPRATPAVAGPDPRAEFEQIAERLRTGRSDFFGRAQLDALLARRRSAGVVGAERVRDAVVLTGELLRLGDVDEALSTIEATLREVAADPQLAPLEVDVHRARGMAWLRKAERENCVARHQPDCCILPLAGGGVHAVREPAERAMESFLFLARRNPDDLEARWLLNVAAMATGDWPDGMPAEHRIPPSALESEIDIGRFHDIAPRLGLDVVDLAGGVVVDDLDGDGLLDVLTTTWDPGKPPHLFLRRADGSFADASPKSGLQDQLGGLNCVGADHDEDGDVDVLVLRGAWMQEYGEIRNSLLRNSGTATFEDVTHAAGLATPARPTQAAAFGDLDGDGDLDLYIGNESRRETMPGSGDHPSQLFLSDGRGSFTDVAAERGVTNDRYAKGVALGDADNDGDLDLYVSNVGANRFYRNDGKAHFEDVAPELGVTEPVGRSFATWFFDYDDDGWLDLYVAGYEARLADMVADMLGHPHRAVLPRLYHNEHGRFRDVTAETGLTHALLPMGASFGDANGDGRLDLYLATGGPGYDLLVPNALLVNDRGQRFLDATTSAGLGHLQKGHGVAFADLDQDGDEDLMHQLGGFYPGDDFANALFENPGHGNAFLVLELSGVQSDRSGYGARMRVVIETPQGSRELHRAVGSVSSFGSAPRRQMLGLGDATRIAELRVTWPLSGRVQTFTDVPLNARLRVTEDSDELERLPYETLRFP